MKKNKIFLFITPILLALISFYLGFSYYKWINPDIYKQPQILWTRKSENIKVKDWHIYLNPRFNFGFKYPREGVLQEGSSPLDGKYQSAWIKLMPPGGSRTNNSLYNVEISIDAKELDNEVSIQDYAKNSQLKPYIDFVPSKNYQEALVDGRKALIVNYEVTDEIVKMQSSYFQTKGSLLPKGYKSKLVFIKDSSIMYTLVSGSLLYKEDEEQFDTLVSTFKFIK